MSYVKVKQKKIFSLFPSPFEAKFKNYFAKLLVQNDGVSCLILENYFKVKLQ